ncbi:tape measure protein [Larkinella sp. C7]|uniref:tape measure protein n=1 Tax=Larkinella sp. C7 TaxID=2576607 RepID=UPI0011111D3D|nr:tape measure protein [Larkinella sp. C7]
MSVREENIRLRIQASSELPVVNDQFNELLKLSRLVAQQIAIQTGEMRAQSESQIKAIGGVTDALKSQRATVQQHDTDVKNAGKSYDDLGKQVRNFATLVGTAFTLNEIKSFGMEVIDAKTKIDSLKIALDVMLGSKKESTALFNDIVALAKKTPFTLDEVAENVVKLKAYNISTKDLIPTVEALGNMAAAVGKEKLPQLTLAYGQVMNMGKLMGTETRQFVEAGIPLYDLLADSMKKPKDEVIKLAQAHKIMASDVQKAVMETSEVGGRFYNMMGLQSKTLGGQVSNLSDTFFIAKARIGDFFEDELKAGIKTTGDLITALIGSDNAIKRTVTSISAIISAFTTWRLATIAQNTASTALNVVKATAQVVYGAYLLVVQRVTTQQNTLTAAQLAATTATRGLWAALSANPLGLIVSIIGTVITGILALDAATQDVTATMGEMEYQVKKEQSELMGLAQRAMSAAEGTSLRKEALEMLIAKYPEYFRGLDSEKTSNSQLKKILDQVNISYQERIDLARDAYKVESLTAKQRELFEKEAALIAKLPQDVQNMIGGSLKNLIEMWQKGMIQGSEAFRNESRDLMDKVFGLNRQISLETINEIINGQQKVQLELGKSGEKIKSQKDKERIAETGAINAHYEVLRQQADGNSKEIIRLNAAEKIEIAKANGTYREKERVASEDDDKNKKIRVSQTEIDIRKLKEKEGELTLEDKKRLLDLEEKLDIENIQKSKLNLIAKQKAVEVVIAEYAPRKAALEIEFEAKKNEGLIEKEKELQNQIEVLTAQRLEAERILVKLQTANTEEERRAVIAEFGKKITDDVKAQAVERLKAQRDASLSELDVIFANQGLKSEAYHKAYIKYLEDDKQYQTALLNQTKEAGQSTIQVMSETEKKIQALQKETAEIEKENIEKGRRYRQEAIQGIVSLLGNVNPVVSQFANGILSVMNNMDLLSGKSREEAETRVNDLKQTLASLEILRSEHATRSKEQTEKTEQDIAKTTKDLAVSQGIVDETKAKAFGAFMDIAGIVMQVWMAIGQAYEKMMQETYQAIADGYAKTREVMADLYSSVSQMNRESLDAQLTDFQGSYAEKEKLINEYYAKEMEYAEGHDRLDAQLAYQQQLAQAQADAGNNAKKLMEGIVQAQADYAARGMQIEINRVEQGIAKAKELRDAKIESLNQELEAFKAAKQAETDELNKQLEAQKAATNQFYSDKQLRLQEDDTYRNQLLAAGEAREVAALQAAMQRELDRATSAEERTQIINAFEALIAAKHAEYQTAIGDKTKEISLATQEAKAQEADKVTALEASTTAEIQKLKDQVAAKEKEVSAAMKAENASYARQVIEAEYQIMDIKKQMVIAELRAEQAMLRGKRWFMNKGKIDSAIADIENAINEINGTGGRQEYVNKLETQERLYEEVQQLKATKSDWDQKLVAHQAKVAEKQNQVNTAESSGQDATALKAELTQLLGDETTIKNWINAVVRTIAEKEEEIKRVGLVTGTEYVDREGNFSNGIDTVPAMLTRGERVLTVDQNQALGGIANEDLVSRVKFFERLAGQFPQLLDPSRWSDIAGLQIGLPAGLLTGSDGGRSVDVSGLRDDLRSVRQAIENQKLLNVNIDRNGFAMHEQGAQSKTNYHQNLLKR